MIGTDSVRVLLISVLRIADQFFVWCTAASGVWSL